MIFGDDSSTICALSTPPGTGGIAVIRVSGRDAFHLTRKICSFLPESPESHRVYFGTARTQVSGESIDEVLVSCFVEGRSFTGEETAEINCHGSPIVVASLLNELVEAGCRSARPGEFTFRSFMNGKLDLVQAEGVLGLIESQSQAAARMALRQIKGRLSAEFSRIEDGLIWILAQLEASIDFSTEGIEVVPSQTILSRVHETIASCEKLLSSYHQGRILAEGLRIALVGRPNVGKSSLLNALLNEDRAIVTATPGTTRDLVEGQISIRGIPVTLVDTAGLRETSDEIEQMGISRARRAIESADLVFHVLEATRSLLPDEISELSRAFGAEGSSRHVIILNKVDDLGDRLTLDTRLAELAGLGIGKQEAPIFEVSARTGIGLRELEMFFESRVQSDGSESSAVVTQSRHYEGLKKIHSCLMRALALTTKDESAEFIAFELQDAVRTIHELLGKEFHEQIIDRIFKEFCIGK